MGYLFNFASLLTVSLKSPHNYIDVLSAVSTGTMGAAHLKKQLVLIRVCKLSNSFSTRVFIANGTDLAQGKAFG